MRSCQKTYTSSSSLNAFIQLAPAPLKKILNITLCTRLFRLQFPSSVKWQMKYLRAISYQIELQKIKFYIALKYLFMNLIKIFLYFYYNFKYFLKPLNYYFNKLSQQLTFSNICIELSFTEMLFCRLIEIIMICTY